MRPSIEARGPLALLVSLAASCATGSALRPDLGKIADSATWQVINGETHLEAEGGKSVVRLFPVGGNRKGSNVAIALVEGLAFDEGVIEADLKGQGEDHASFLGVAFGVTDERSYEAIYFRPFNFRAEDPTKRGHAVQYVAWPADTWEALRARSPGVYEAAIDPVPAPEGWFHARIEVTPKQVRVFVNEAAKPCLVVERLHAPVKSEVGLWVDSAEGSFSGLTVRPGHFVSSGP